MRGLIRFLRRSGLLPTKIVVTDLTRFANADTVCLAGINAETGDCIRPLPHITLSACQRLIILPGTLLSARFYQDKQSIKLPHSEDRRYRGLRYKGVCPSQLFKTVLENSLSNSIQAGFTTQWEIQRKRILVEQAPPCSIITIKAHPHSIELAQQRHKPDSLKLSFTDMSGQYYDSLPVTDLRFHLLAQQNYIIFSNINSFLSAQTEVYLRVGLGRAWNRPGEQDAFYWLQINGIYTFPKQPIEYEHGIWKIS